MIKQIILKNYKSIKDATIDLGRINLLIGGNGAGKSNFISFFELLLAVYDQRLRGYVLQRGGAKRLLYNGIKNSSEICATVNFDDKNALELCLHSSAESNTLFIERIRDYFNGFGDHERKYSLWHSELWDSMCEESTLKARENLRVRYLKKYLTGLNVYHFHDTSRTAHMRSPGKILDCESLRDDASNLAACINKMQINSPSYFLILEGVVRSIAPYFKCFKLTESPFDPSDIVLQWEVFGSDEYFDAFSFSDGTIRFIALATLLLQDNKPATIIIDEPELGLHPFAILKLAALIRRAALESQIIIASQSTNLINQFNPEDIIVVGRKENCSTFNHLNKDELDVWLEQYSLGDIWEKNLIGGAP